jgi:lipoprotein-releasing system permease protein
MPWYVYLAFKQLFPTGKGFSFFAIMAIVGVTLGVMVLVVVETVMNGFGKQIGDTIHNAGGDIQIRSSSIIHNQDALINELKTHKFIEAVAPQAAGIMMLNRGNNPGFPIVKGIDLDLEDKVVPIRKYVVAGSVDDLDDESIILGSSFAREIGATVGSTVDLYSPLMLERMKQDEVLLPRELKVIALYQTGWNEVDSKFALISLRLMQELYALNDGIQGVTAKLVPGTNTESAVAELKNTFKGTGYQVTSWMDLNEPQLFVLRLEKTMMFFIIIFIILVASFSIASSLMTSVVRKIREIGLIAAMGGRPIHIAACFCFQGFVIGVAGTILGCLFGIFVLYFRTDIVQFLAILSNREETLVKFYKFTEVPAHYMLSDFVAICIASISIATLAGLLPAIRAARLKPSEALRNE